QGLGTIIGDRNVFDKTTSSLNDSDTIDTIDLSASAQVPDWLKSLVQEKKKNDQTDVECSIQY
ncbi:MAG: hypothetical protein ACRCWQ_13625, partial [Bacilli bacterium]